MVVCDPVKRVLSRYYHMYEDNDEIKLETFEEQVRFSLNRIQEQDHWDHLLDRVCYNGKCIENIFKAEP